MKTKKIFFDLEFKEDGRVIDLISVGMVKESGEEYYAVSNEFDTRAVAKDWWLMENVMSSIEHEKFIVADFEGKPFVRDLYVTDRAAKSRQKMREEILEFVGEDTIPEWWAWYSCYDHVGLMQLLFGKMTDQKEGWPYMTRDIAELRIQAGMPKMPRQPAGLHNALEDAKFNVERYNYLKGYDVGNQ